MRIDPQLCVGCSNCVAVCPMGAISIDPATGRAVISLDECVECFACHRGMSTETLSPGLVRALRGFLHLFRLRFDPEPDICPTGAIVPDDLTWPRTVRRAFSDVRASHEDTGVQGRGTEEVKTNDVTGRIGPDDIGFVVELGRPAIGARFRDIDRVTRSLAESGVAFERDNPITGLLDDVESGAIRADILDEKVMSAIVEFRVGLDEVPGVLDRLERVAEQVDTVIAVGVATRCDETGANRLEGVLDEAGYPALRAKTNIGLGRLT
ncbi:MAG: 4Fe-4S dicluster domain-containing protein [Gemmatimonadota bacterium]